MRDERAAESCPAFGKHALDLRRADQPAIPWIATEQLVRALASDDNAHVSAGQLRDGMQGYHRRIGERLIERRQHRRRPARDVGLVDHQLVMNGPQPRGDRRA